MEILCGKQKMTENHFSASLLRRLRNQIPIAHLIEKELKVPCEKNQGTFRFFCPLCNGSETRINTHKNLARCFKCQKNFNPIDIVIAVKQVKFVTAVNYLIKQINNFKPSSPQLENSRNDQKILSVTNTNKRIFENKPIPINEIIPSIIERAKSKKEINETCCDGCLSLARRLERAEKELKQVKLQMAKVQILLEQYPKFNAIQHRN
jgi:hypothetical protein